MNDLARALLDRRFPLADAAAAMDAPVSALEPGTDADGLIVFRVAVALGLAHHRQQAPAPGGAALAPFDRAAFRQAMLAARHELGEDVSLTFAACAVRVADLRAPTPWEARARQRVAVALRNASTRRHGRRRCNG